MRKQYVFIAAAGHSGSTLLNLMLGAHPEGLALGEITQLPKNIALDSTCSCGEPVSVCSFWSQRISEIGRRLGMDLWSRPYDLYLGFIMAGREIDRSHQTRLRMLHRRLTFGLKYLNLAHRIPVPAAVDRRLELAARNKQRLFDFLLESTGADFIVDSSKHYLDAFHLHRAAPDQTRILLLVRDGRAVFNSGVGRGLSKEAALSAWASIYKRGLPIFDRHLPPESWRTVHYERLASEPRQELESICEFLGIPFRDEMLDFADVENHILNGNRMRFAGDSKVRLDERWRRELDTDALEFFSKRVGSLNRRLGYT